jgi:hypothetical protein
MENVQLREEKQQQNRWLINTKLANIVTANAAVYALLLLPSPSMLLSVSLRGRRMSIAAV